jgi:SAM-dependent methyltransferase
VTDITSQIAKELLVLSSPEDVMLEAGCGSGGVSAQLALAGRRIELADFSEAILQRACGLFVCSALPIPKLVFCDITKPLPWTDRAVDIVWSSGVLEHWTDKELVPILAEMSRVSRRLVVSLVPSAESVFYRWGKKIAEDTNRWPYGREIPRETMQSVFESAGIEVVFEKRIMPECSASFLAYVDSVIPQRAAEWLDGLPDTDPLRKSQGYLLLTVGKVKNGDGKEADI